MTIRQRSRARRYLFRAAAGLSVGIVVVIGTAGAYLLALPGVGSAEAQTHRILSSHYGTFLAPPVPRKLASAVVAVEDEHFYANIVVDMADGAGRAALALGSTADPGGSTITQQLAKQLYPQGSGISGTLAEIGLAVKISLAYSKPQILDMWLNSVYYGNGYWGAQTAAEGYFGVPARSLDWAEAAMLAGLPQAPSAYDPLSHFALAKQRQLHVLARLVATHQITPSQGARAGAQRLHFRP